MSEFAAATESWLKNEVLRIFEGDITRLSEGKIGVMKLLVAGVKSFGPRFVIEIERHGLKGSDIWILFKDLCGSDLQLMMARLQGKEPLSGESRPLSVESGLLSGESD